MKKKVWLPTIIMFFFGVLFLMPIILLVMNAFKTHNDMIQNFLHCRKAFILLCTYRNNIMPGQHFIKEIKEQHFQRHITI